MSENTLSQILAEVACGQLSSTRAEAVIREYLGAESARRSLEGLYLDVERNYRCGLAEVVFAQGKSPAALCTALQTLAMHGPVLASRVSPEQGRMLTARFAEGLYWPEARLFALAAPLRFQQAVAALARPEATPETARNTAQEPTADGQHPDAEEGSHGLLHKEQKTGTAAFRTVDFQTTPGQPAEKPADASLTGPAGPACQTAAARPGGTWTAEIHTTETQTTEDQTAASQTADPDRALNSGSAAQDEAPLAVVVAAGAADRAVALEALGCLLFWDQPALCIHDVGVAGLHRILPYLDTLRRAKIIIAVAGMEGALPGLLASLTPAPVLAVPTAVGYGLGQGGRAALTSMLCSCVPGQAVLNIDNGFGAAAFAVKVLRHCS